MARNQHRNWVRSAGTANGADGFSISNFISHFAIAQRFAASDALQHEPNALLKIAAGG